MTGRGRGRAQRAPRARQLPATIVATLAVAVLTVILLGPVAAAHPAAAAPAAAAPSPTADHEDDGDPVLTLLEQTPWVSTGGVFAARLAVSGAPPGASVEGALFPAVGSGEEVGVTAGGDDLGRRLETLPEVPLNGDGGSVVVRLPIGREEADTPHIDLDPGVYPLALDLFDASGDRITRLMTHVVVIDAQMATSPLARRPVALVARVDQPFRMDGQGRLQLVGGPDGLTAAVDLLRQATNVPITVAATPASLAALAERTAASGPSSATASPSPTTTTSAASPAAGTAGTSSTAGPTSTAAGGATSPTTPTTSATTNTANPASGGSAGPSAAADAQQRARTEADLQQVAAHAQVLDLPFAALAPGPWLANGLLASLADQLQGGTESLSSSFGAAPDATTWLVTPTDDLPLLNWLTTRGVSTFLVPSDLAGEATEPDDHSPPPTGAFRLAQVQGPHEAFSAEHVGPQAGPNGARPHPVGDAYQLLARLAVSAIATSSEQADPVPAVLLVDDLSPAALPYLSTILAALGQPGPLAPLTVSSLRQVTDGAEATTPADEGADPVSWPVPTAPPTDLGGLPADLAQAQAAIASYVASVGANDPALLPLRRTVLAMGAGDLRAEERADLRARVESAVQLSLAGIQVGGEQPVTVTAHRSTLPLTIRNAGTRSLTVAVAVDSSDLELDGATTRTLRLEPGATTDLDVPVLISRSGDFRLRVRVTSPDGRLQLAERVVTVRSTAISGVGVFLSLGALLFLFVWWGRHVRRTRRARRAAPPEQAQAPVDPTTVASTSSSPAVQHQPVDEPVP